MGSQILATKTLCKGRIILYFLITTILFVVALSSIAEARKSRKQDQLIRHKKAIYRAFSSGLISIGCFAISFPSLFRYRNVFELTFLVFAAGLMLAAVSIYYSRLDAAHTNQNTNINHQKEMAEAANALKDSWPPPPRLPDGED